MYTSRIVAHGCLLELFISQTSYLTTEPQQCKRTHTINHTLKISYTNLHCKLLGSDGLVALVLFVGEAVGVTAGVVAAG